MKKLLNVLCALVVVLGLTACGGEKEEQQQTDSKKLTVYTSSGYPPYEVINDETKELEGFDIDLMEAIGKELGYEIVWKDIDFNGIVSGLQSNKADLAIAGLSPDPERLKSIDMSINYYDASKGLEHVILSTKDIKQDNLNGLKIGCQQGTIQETLLNAYADKLGYTVDPRVDYASILMEIKKGKLDAIVVEKPVGHDLIEQQPDFKSNPFDYELDESNGNAIGFPKGSALKDPMNEVITKFAEDGTIDKLIAKWFAE